MRHADDDVFDAERPAALDDLFQRRDHQLAAVEPEALGAGELQVAELFEAFGLDQLVEDGALALAGEADLLVGPLDAFLQPGLLRRIGDVHELDAQRLAVGAPQDRENLVQRAELQAEHPVEKDPAVHVGVGEAVGARVEVGLGPMRLEAERIEIGVEVAARPVGADQHQGVDRVARRLLDMSGREFDAAGLRARLELVADRPLDLVPVAIQGGNQFVARPERPIRPFPGRPLGASQRLGLLVLQALEKLLPFGVDRIRVGLIAGVEVFDIGRVAAIEERSAGKGGIGVLAGHVEGPGSAGGGPNRPAARGGGQFRGLITSMLQLRGNNCQKLNYYSYLDVSGRARAKGPGVTAGAFDYCAFNLRVRLSEHPAAAEPIVDADAGDPHRVLIVESACFPERRRTPRR